MQLGCDRKNHSVLAASLIPGKIISKSLVLLQDETSPPRAPLGRKVGVSVHKGDSLQLNAKSIRCLLEQRREREQENNNYGEIETNSWPEPPNGS